MISALIPVHNGAEHLGRALESVLAQTHAPAEIIVLDDGSTDRTAEVASSYSGVRLIQQENRGIGATRRRLVEEAKGDWLAFLDHDDYWSASKLAHQVQFIDSAEVGLVHTRDVFFYPEGGATEGNWLPPRNATSLDHVLPDCRINMSSVLVRKAAIEQAGNFTDTSKAEDWLMWQKVAAAWDFAFVPEPLTWTMRGQASASTPSAAWYAGERSVLCDHILPQFDELYANYSQEQRERYRTLIRLKLGAIASLHAEALDREGRHKEARKLHLEAIKSSPTRKGAWLRLGKNLARIHD